MIVATGTTIKVMDATFKKNGRVVGTLHYHYKAGKVFSHRHEGGHLTHTHRGMKGYGKTRKSLRKW